MALAYVQSVSWDLSTSIAALSGVTAPWLLLSALTSPKVPFTWSPAADQTFRDIKHCFTTAPILVHPDPSRQFEVEDDASDVGVGAVLSQRSALDLRLHPCAFFSHCLNTTEMNYDVGNPELLAVKMEEWRHRLEGRNIRSS